MLGHALRPATLSLLSWTLLVCCLELYSRTSFCLFLVMEACLYYPLLFSSIAAAAKAMLIIGHRCYITTPLNIWSASRADFASQGTSCADFISQGASCADARTQWTRLRLSNHCWRRLHWVRCPLHQVQQVAFKSAALKALVMFELRDLVAVCTHDPWLDQLTDVSHVWKTNVKSSQAQSLLSHLKNTYIWYSAVTGKGGTQHECGIWETHADNM